MKSKVFCPNCHNSIRLAVFDDSGFGQNQEFYCDKCNLSFSLHLNESDKNDSGKINGGLIFDLSMELENQKLWNNVDKNLFPVLSCAFCDKITALGQRFHDNEVPIKCRSCGVGYYLNIQSEHEINTGT